MSYVIGIDMGTSSVKALAIGPGGFLLGVRTQSYPAFTDRNGQHEEDPDVIFEATIQVTRALMASLPPDGPPSGISFSAAMHGLMAVDSEGRPLTRLITWADTRSGPASKALHQKPVARDIYRRTGTPIHPMSPLCKLIWLAGASPLVFSQAAKFISIKEYVWYKLFGVFEVDHSIASATGLFETCERRWLDIALLEAGITADRLSVPVSVTHSRTDLPDHLRQRCGLPAGVPFIIGAGDGCLANLGSGVVSPGEVSVTIGTSGAVRVVSPVWETDPRERLFSYLLIDHQYVRGGAVNNGGNVLDWFESFFATSTSEDLVEAFTIDQGAEGLLFLPYLKGERAPLWDAGARGAYIGLRSYHRKAHLLRAITEGICYALFDVFEVLKESGPPIQTVYASGGFTRTEAWVQLLADVFGKPVCLTEEADASATGAALLGMISLGTLADMSDAKQYIRQGKTFTPRADSHAFHQGRFTLFRSLYPTLKATFDALDVSP